MEKEVLLGAIPEILTQLFGFLLVFWVLKKYAFEAIFKTLDERRNTIRDSFKQIEDQKKELEELEKDYRSKLQGIDQEARKRLQEAVQEGNRIGREIKDAARAESLKQVERLKADMEQELKKARATLRREIVSLSTEMAEKVLRKKLNRKEDEAYVDSILKDVEKV